ncbi:hypothetical protein EVAR_43011_1 [Eumeta japonica]|uniref:Uncharacterized protein n=1 Tax=Eumeta variegata TaxID=151549 RepID=A0A4C1XP63_EUMVA|nr:hypothetical protein EVAR_43011_1 [Eumeta japonica]
MPEWKGRVPLTRSHCERITSGPDLPKRLALRQNMVLQRPNAEFLERMHIRARQLMARDACVWGQRPDSSEESRLRLATNFVCESKF